MRELGVRFVNVTAASPYYNPHLIRPALYPPSDGYHPPEDPFIGVMRQLEVVRDLKAAFPDFCLMGSGYTYLQEFFPNVAQAVVRMGWVDLVGLGRMVLAYPELPLDILQGKPVNKKRNCRTFSDCTTAPRNGIVSGCYPLDRALQEVAGIQAARRAQKSPGGLADADCFPPPHRVAGHRHHGNAYGAAAGPGRLSRHGLESKRRQGRSSSRSSA